MLDIPNNQGKASLTMSHLNVLHSKSKFLPAAI